MIEVDMEFPSYESVQTSMWGLLFPYVHCHSGDMT